MLYVHKVVELLPIADYLLAHGLAPGAVLRDLGLPAITLIDEEAWLDRNHVLQLGVETERQTGDSLAGFHVAEYLKIGDLGTWGRAVQRAATLREAVVAAAQQITRLETGTRIQLIPDGSKARLSIEFIGRVDADPRQQLDARLLILRKILDLAAEPIAAQAQIPHQPIRTWELERVLGPDLKFHADKPALVFDRDALSVPLRRLPEQEAATDPRTDIARQVIRAVEHLIEAERPTAKSVAAALGIQLRTMQRYLAAWGVSFEVVLDQYRQRVAMNYLTSSRYTVTEIAFRLGYSDSAHFTRAFRRWTGSCPRQIRAAGGAPVLWWVPLSNGESPLAG